ncbi:MAG: hypothetical protein B7Y01_00090 [Xanthobacter sp. 17-67-6]|nr:MAG: hypothetical protein B7Y01_00090 [Xanthobacter sp. 17-67-6]
MRAREAISAITARAGGIFGDVAVTATPEQIAGWNGNPSDGECAAVPLRDVGMFAWRTLGEYLDCLERNRTATNVAALVPQGNLRLLACGPYDTAAKVEEIDDQVKLLREAMDQGAVGMSRYVTCPLWDGDDRMLTCEFLQLAAA